MKQGVWALAPALRSLMKVAHQERQKAKFNAPELLNNRPTAPLVRNSTQIDADAVLAAFHDRYDSVLYRAVRSRFEREWRELALSPQRCRQICPEAAA